MVLSDPDETDPARRATLQAVASTYRALRAGLETRRDAPGAADFYYGEMEMRRLASPHFSSERTLLTLYWSLSGYGLRASRSLLALFALTIASAFVFDYVGFASSQPTFGRALIASFASELPFIRGLGIPELTTTGEAMKIVLGVAGPILCGLTLLALRGRVRR